MPTSWICASKQTFLSASSAQCLKKDKPLKRNLEKKILSLFITVACSDVAPLNHLNVVKSNDYVLSQVGQVPGGYYAGKLMESAAIALTKPEKM